MTEALQSHQRCSLKEVIRPDRKTVTFEYDVLGRQHATPE
jgi:hypothetical protein